MIKIHQGSTRKIRTVIGVIAAGGLLSMVAPTGAVGAAADRVQQVFVTNGGAHPVPTRSPLWQGTPYLSTARFSAAGCVEPTTPIPAGQVLFVERAVTRFISINDPAVSAGLRITPPMAGGQPALDSGELVTIPSPSRTTPDGAVAAYEGSVEIGLPTTTIAGCVNFGTYFNEQPTVTVIGYLLPAP